MNLKTLLPVLLLLALRGFQLQAQNVDPTDISGFQDLSGDPWSSYVDVAQFYPEIALRMIVGEVAIIHAGDRTEIRWDHPLALQKETSYLPLYNYNSSSFANEAVTKPFVFRSDDRLLLLRDFGFRFPAVDEKGETLSAKDGASAMRITDTIDFAVEIVDAVDRKVLRTLDRFIIPPCANWEQFVETLNLRAAEPVFASAGLPFMITMTPDDDMLNRAVRLRASAVFRSATSDEFKNRALYMRFQSFERISKHLIDSWGALTDEFEKKAEALLASIGKKSGFGPLPYGKPRDPSISIYPNSLPAQEPVLYVNLGGDASGGTVLFTVADVTGRILHQERREVNAAANTAFQLPETAVRTAMVFVYAQFNDRFNYTLVRVAR